MPSTSFAHVSDISGPSGKNAADLQDLWEQALNTLSAEDRTQFGEPSSSMIDVLKGVQEATESKKTYCLSKGWRLYRNKKGEEVKLRHVLEKISTWVKAIIKVVDAGVSADQSGHATLPWAIVKYLVMIGFSDIDEFSNVAEGIETVASLIARYTIVEKLYLQQDCEAQEGLQKAITKLYAAVLTYLAKVKAYVSKNTLKRFGRSLIDTIRKQYDELWAKISELEVGKWTNLVDAEIQRASREDATADIRMLRDIMNGLNKPVMQMSDQISMLQDKFNRDERAKIFRWMSTIEYRSHHDDLSKGVLAHSGRWLLDSQLFVEWGQSSVSSILWLHGIPGSGKTRLLSTVVNTMLKEDPDSNTSSTAFFYCARSTAEPARAKPTEIMGALLRQLAGSRTDLPIKTPVAKEYETRREKAEEDCSMLKKLTVQDCTRLIVELTKNQSATIVLDALDECEENTRHELLEAFDEIICNSGEVVKVLVSSRDDIDIKLHLERSKNISISADNNSSDIARFVDTEVDLLIQKRLLLDGNVSAKMKRKIIQTLTDGAQGMFRWVEMSLETLKRIKFLPDFKKALGQLPSELAVLYDIIHSQIERTEPYGKRVAVRTLSWLLCAQRLLSAEELVAAVYILQEDASSDSDDDPEFKVVGSPEDDILRLCRNLVVFDSEQDIFRFAHQSVREYLLKLSRYTIVEQHALAAERCLEIYLINSLQDPILREVKRQNTILKPYAEIYWPVHYKYAENFASVQLKNKLLRFTDQVQGTLSPYVEWRGDILQQYDNYVALNLRLHLDMNDRLGKRILCATYHPDAPFGLASAFGIASILETCQPSSKELNEHSATYWATSKYNTTSFTLLSLAAREGHDQVVQLLLDKGADVNAADGLALQKAARWGRTQILETLLNQESVDTNNLPRLLKRLLLQACRKGNVSTVRLLLERGADVRSYYTSSGSALGLEESNIPLQMASLEGDISIVQLLLDYGADVNASSECGSALQTASFEGHESIVQLLLDYGADVNASSECGSALQTASSEGHESIVQLLLDNGADIDASDENDTALEIASYGGHESIVQLLLDHGADVNAPVGNFGNVLNTASYKGHRSIVQLLLDHGADVNASGSGGHNALQTAVYWDRSYIVRMLLDYGADINARSEEDGSALQMALRGYQDHIAQTLLERGADVDANDEDDLQKLCSLGRISLPSRLKHLTACLENTKETLADH